MQTTRAPSPPVSTSKRAGARDLLRALRPVQWTKNLIVFTPLLFAGKAHDPRLLLCAGLCFFAFCLSASASYVINDVLDKAADKLHPLKSTRPVASGKISTPGALGLASLLLPLAVCTSLAVRPALLVIVSFYLATTMLYSFKLKHVALADVLAIATGFVLRAVAGAVAVKVPVSTWFLLCTSLGALYLALEKRRHELSLLKADAEAHRKGLTTYTPELVDRLESVILPGLLTCYVLYSFQSVHGQWMMLTVPFVLYGIMRYQTLSAQGDSSCGSPEQVILKDKPIQTTIGLWLISSVLVVYGVLPKLIAALFVMVDGTGG